MGVREQSLKAIRMASLVMAVAALVAGAILAFSLVNLRQDMMLARQQKIQSIVEGATGLVSAYRLQEMAGSLTHAQAQQRALAALGNLRFDDGNAVWVSDMVPRIILSPSQPELEGQDFSTVHDSNGVAVFQAALQMVQQSGQGTIHYAWAKPGHAQPVEKLSFVSAFAPWGWVIGAELYLDDVDEAVQRQTLVVGGALSVVMLFCVLVVVLFYRKSVAIRAVPVCRPPYLRVVS